VLALNGVTRRFGEYTAVDNVSVEVGPGELLALVGASGSGKTTTLRIAAGYEQPDAGTVTLGGADITGVPPERRGFGMVFQHYALFPHMPVEENVAFGLEARGAKLEKALELLVGHERHELSSQLPAAVGKVFAGGGGQLVDVLGPPAAVRRCGGDGREPSGFQRLEVAERALLRDLEVRCNLAQASVPVRLQKGEDRLAPGIHVLESTSFSTWTLEYP
jgi:ABC-type sugar transport system ATPase subunit